MLIHFHKYQGTGNDFIIIDNRNQSISLSQVQIEILCDRRFGIGADGLMLLENENGFDFRMTYYNSDGKISSMCGNGGRCISMFAYKNGLPKEKLEFIAIDGPHTAKILSENLVSLKMNDVPAIEAGDNFFYLNTGSPHYVKFVEDIEHYPVYQQGYAIRNSERFKNEGTNVNFIEKKGETLFVRTYERGVESETLSCGTGVTAAALVSNYSGLIPDNGNCQIQTPGGKLSVKFHNTAKGNWREIWLEGKAEFVFKGEIEI